MQHYCIFLLYRADPGFPGWVGGWVWVRVELAPTCYLVKISRKLHGNDENLTESGAGRTSTILPCRAATALNNLLSSCFDEFRFKAGTSAQSIVRLNSSRNSFCEAIQQKRDK